MSVRGRLDRLADVVQRANGVPLSASCVVNRADLLALVEAARAELPVELHEAQDVMQRADDLVAHARAEAERVLASAGRQADALVSSGAVLALARERAEATLEDARAQAQQVRREADDYCDRRLAQLEIDLDRALAQVRRGRDRLAERLGGPGEHRVIDLTAVEPGLGTAADLQ
jgi:cell division septum initiation protein DivIVA